MQLLERIDRMGRPLAPDLQIGHCKPALVALEGQPAQLEPVGGSGLVLNRLVRGYPCGNHHHSIEMQLKVRLLGADEVSKVWRIERPAENADAHRSVRS